MDSAVGLTTVLDLEGHYQCGSGSKKLAFLTHRLLIVWANCKVKMQRSSNRIGEWLISYLAWDR